MLRSSSMLIAVLGALLITGPAGAEDRSHWKSEKVAWRISGGPWIRAVRYPTHAPVPTRADHPVSSVRRISKEVLSSHATKRLGTAVTSTSVMVNVVDSPPIDGPVPWLAVVTTDAAGDELELDAVPTSSVVGNYLVGNPQTAYAVGIYDTGASISLLGHDAAVNLGLFSASPDFITSSTVPISGVTGSVDAWVSMPLGLYVDGLGAVDPNTLELDTSSMVGQWNVSVGVGQSYTPPQPDLPTAIGSPLAVYYAAVVNNGQMLTIQRDGNTYSGPDIRVLDRFDPAVPDYPNLVPLELRPLGSSSVQYVPCSDLFGGCPDGFVPQTPSVIIGNSSQSLFFIGSGVDLTDDGNSAIDKDRFMFDMGAQVTVVGSRVAARLALDPNNPDFEVEIEGVTGDVSFEPGFFVDTIDIPALGEWLSYTQVPVVLLDAASPEGGTLDGIIGMNLLTRYNFVLRGGGLFLQDDPALEFQLIPYDSDFDDDGDVDQADFAFLQACITGIDVPQTDPDCADARLDNDDDVDEDDVNLFEDCASGPGIPAGTTCAD